MTNANGYSEKELVRLMLFSDEVCCIVGNMLGKPNTVGSNVLYLTTTGTVGLRTGCHHISQEI